LRSRVSVLPLIAKLLCTIPIRKRGLSLKLTLSLSIQTRALDQLGQTLSREGFELRVHHHSPEMADNAREWRHILNHTDPKYVWLCLDLDWIHQGDQDPISLLKEANSRVKEIHVRNSRNRLWLESVQDGDIDYAAVAAYLKGAQLSPLIVVELAYKQNTVVTRSLVEDLRVSRLYTERVFGFEAGA
jgi:inosose dehydratase